MFAFSDLARAAVERPQHEARNVLFKDGQSCRMATLNSHFDGPEYKTFYHHTDRDGYMAILKSGYIRGSGRNGRDAAYGKGVYGTSKPPDCFQNETEVLVNNFYPSQDDWYERQMRFRAVSLGVLFAVCMSIFVLPVMALLWVHSYVSEKCLEFLIDALHFFSMAFFVLASLFSLFLALISLLQELEPNMWYQLFRSSMPSNLAASMGASMGLSCVSLALAGITYYARECCAELLSGWKSISYDSLRRSKGLWNFASKGWEIIECVGFIWSQPWRLPERSSSALSHADSWHVWNYIALEFGGRARYCMKFSVPSKIAEQISDNDHPWRDVQLTKNFEVREAFPEMPP